MSTELISLSCLKLKTWGFRYRLFNKLKNDVLLSKGYTGAHIGLYITSNGENSNDYVDFDYIDYSVKNQ